MLILYGIVMQTILGIKAKENLKRWYHNMEWLEQLNNSITYLENHLDKEISYEQAAKIACCSTYHFQRMFSYIANIPLAEYIRRRRMTLAAFDLQHSNKKIIDIAMKYGYESPTAFNRAFQSIHGVTPTAAREEGISLKAFPRILFHISIKGDSEMNYRIETKPAFRIVGVKEHYTMHYEESFLRVPNFWLKAAESGNIPKIASLINETPYGLLGVSVGTGDKNFDYYDFDYYIAAPSNLPLPDGLTEYMIPEGTWAIFTCIGKLPETLQEMQKRAVTEWLPTSGYEYANAPDIEVYYEGNQQADDYKCEIWLPVIKR